MSIFDKLRTNLPTKLTPKAAVALAALTMIGIDGSIDDEEVDSLQRIVRDDQQALDTALATYKDLSVKDSIQLVSKALDEKQRFACVAILLDVAMADGILAGAELDLIKIYLNVFQISEQAISGIVDVIALKNDFSIF